MNEWVISATLAFVATLTLFIISAPTLYHDWKNRAKKR